MLYYRKLWFLLTQYKRQEMAATAIEYGLLVAFIAIFIMGAVLAIGDYLDGFFQAILDYINSVQ